MSKPYIFKSKSTIIDQYKMNIILSLEAKKKAILTSEILDKIRKVLSKKEYETFLILAKKVTYKELEEIFESIYKKRCVQKKC